MNVVNTLDHLDFVNKDFMPNFCCLGYVGKIHNYCPHTAVQGVYILFKGVICFSGGLFSCSGGFEAVQKCYILMQIQISLGQC